jgi:hypothetical protein
MTMGRHALMAVVDILLQTGVAQNELIELWKCRRGRGGQCE